jgi:[ribosomal protein S18]-alanine N-acetyltransferase
MPTFHTLASFLQSRPDDSPPRPLPVRLRMMIPRDLLDVHRVETRSFSDPWPLEGLRCLLRRDGIGGVVAEAGSLVVGFAIHERTHATLAVLALAVEPKFRRRGVGRRLVDHAIDRPDRPARVVIDVPEADLDAQLFLRACGVKAIGILTALQAGCRVDVIRFEDRARECGGK